MISLISWREYIIDSPEILEVINKDPEVKKIIYELYTQPFRLLYFIDSIKELLVKRWKKVNTKLLQKVEDDYLFIFNEVYTGSDKYYDNASYILWRNIKFYSDESFYLLTDLFLSRNINLILGLFNEELDNELLERIDLIKKHSNSILKPDEHLCIWSNSLVHMSQDLNWDIFFDFRDISRIKSSYLWFLSRYPDLFKENNYSEVIYDSYQVNDSLGSFTIFQEPDTLYESLVAFCIKYNYYPLSIESIFNNSISPVVPHAEWSYFDTDIKTFKWKIMSDTFDNSFVITPPRDPTINITINENWVILHCKEKKFKFEIWRDIILQIMLWLNKLPWRSVLNIKDLNRFLHSKYLEYSSIQEDIKED